MKLNKNKSGIFKIQKKKSKITFLNKKTNQKESIKIRGIPLIDNYKYLGITLDSSLTMNTSIRKLKETCH